jgi:hypothetical protein
MLFFQVVVGSFITEGKKAKEEQPKHEPIYVPPQTPWFGGQPQLLALHRMEHQAITMMIQGVLWDNPMAAHLPTRGITCIRICSGWLVIVREPRPLRS